eukprot:5572754-Ditylum_brightwellii.AAC.1
MDINMIKVAAGALGTICQNLDDLLTWVSPCANLDLIQKKSSLDQLIFCAIYSHIWLNNCLINSPWLLVGAW